MNVMALVLLSAATICAPDLMPDASTGQISGKPAVLFWPTRGEGTEALIADLSRCVLHIEPDDAQEELQLPCGEWFLPPRGRYRAWVESDSWISDTPIVSFYGGRPFRGEGSRVVIPVVPAAIVRVHDTGVGGDAERFRVLSFPSEGFFFDREAKPGVAEGGLLEPSERVAIAVAVNKNDEVIALSKPMKVDPHGSSLLELRRPSGTADLYSVFVRPYDAKSPDKTTIELFLDTRTRRGQPADFLYATPSRVLAIWYGVAATDATIRATGAGATLESVPVRLTAGQVTSVRRNLHLH